MRMCESLSSLTSTPVGGTGASAHTLRRRRKGHPVWWRRYRRPGRPILRPGERFRLLFDSGQIESEILLLSIAENRDARLTGGAEVTEDLLPAGRVIERRTVDGRHQIARLEAQTHE